MRFNSMIAHLNKWAIAHGMNETMKAPPKFKVTLKFIGEKEPADGPVVFPAAEDLDALADALLADDGAKRTDDEQPVTNPPEAKREYSAVRTSDGGWAVHGPDRYREFVGHGREARERAEQIAARKDRRHADDSFFSALRFGVTR